MKLTSSFLFPVLIGATSAAEHANVYIFDGAKRTTTNTPSLSPEQARLVFAQRLGTSQYHGIGDASESTLSYINKFGGQHESLFQDTIEDRAAELVVIVEGVSSENVKPLLKEWSSTEPAFTISHPPSMVANKKLVSDLQKQTGQGSQDCSLENAINPYDRNCWNGRSNAIHFDLAAKGETKIEELMAAQKRLLRFAEKAEMNVVVVLMPESSRTSKTSGSPYGSYEAVAMANVRRQAVEEPMTETPAASTPPMFSSKQLHASNSTNSTVKPLPKLPPLCHSSKDACQTSTNNCSGHGTCFKKYSTSKAACFTCACTPSIESFVFGNDKKKYYQQSTWGGAACHKKDVSVPFWLISLFTIVMVGTISWGIGLMYSIGEEKLPGVIGAGVSSGKTR